MPSFGRLLTIVSFALASAKSLKNELGHRQICGGVYGPEDSGGPYEPTISVNFPTKDDSKGDISVVVYDFADIDSIGFPVEDGAVKRWEFMCTQQDVYAHHCDEKDLGKFIVNKQTTRGIKTEIVHVEEGKKVEPLVYSVKQTGYYCVAAVATPGHENMKFDVDVVFQNAYGYLPGTDYPLITFHYVMSGVYGLIALIWIPLLIRYRKSVLTVQLYITALVIFMIAEQAIVASYFLVVNKDGRSPLSIVFLVLTSLMGSARLAYTFFVLLIVAWGYSVVHPSLGPKRRQAIIVGAAVWVLAFTYSILDYYETESNSSRSWLPIFTEAVFFPLIAVLALNYFMILNGLKETMAYLTSRKQTAKVQMYRFVSWVLIGSLLAITLQLIVLIIQFVFTSVKDVVNNYWRSQWVVYDGWPNIVYCIALLLIMILWRPNRDNMRYALSTQLAQSEDDAEEFEIGSLNGSDDDLEIPTGEEYTQPAQPRREWGYAESGGDHQFDHEAEHDLSDLEGDEFEVNLDDRNLPDDEDSLVQAPTQNLGKKNR